MFARMSPKSSKGRWLRLILALVGEVPPGNVTRTTNLKQRGRGSRGPMCERQCCVRQSAKAAKPDSVIHRCIFNPSIMRSSYNSSRAPYSLVSEWHCNPRRRCSRTRIRIRLQPGLQVSKSSEMEIQRGIRDEDLRLAALECASFPHTI